MLYNSCDQLTLNCEWKILRDYFIVHNQSFIVNILCDVWSLIFEDKNGYNPLKMVQIASKYVGVISL
jgi:hypothetical protein